jgi:hypothetical protein
METKKSVVRSAIFKKAFSGKNGLAYIFEITFDNGDTGQFFNNAETQDTFKEGVEIDYTIEKKVNGNYTNYSVKPVKNGNGFVPGKGNPSYEHKRVALKCAVDLCAADKIEKKDIAMFAESFMKFLNS